MNTHALKGKLKQKYAGISGNGVRHMDDELLGRIDQNSGRSIFPSAASKHNESGDDRPELYDDEPVCRNKALHPG